MGTAPRNARVRPLAAEDLEQIVRYLDEQSASPAAADHFLEEFFNATNMLGEMPRLGPVRRARGQLKGLRSWPLTRFGPYVIFYMPRVLHGARNVDRELRKS